MNSTTKKKNLMQSQASYVSVKQRIVGFFTATILLLQICLPTVASAARLLTNESVTSAMASPSFQRSNSNAYLYQQASFDDAAYIGSQNITTFRERLVAAKSNLGKPTFIPIASDITIFVPTYPTGKLLGDVYVQNRYIRQQVFELLGRHLIYANSKETSETQQINALYENAYDYARKNPSINFGDNLDAGALSHDINFKDMVWPEIRTIHNERVVVPVLYLTDVTVRDNKVTSTRTEFPGDDVKIGSLSLDSEELTLGASTITDIAGNLTADKGSLINSHGDIDLVVGGTLNLIGSSITGKKNVTIFANEANIKSVLVPFQDRYGSGTKLGRISGIDAGENISLTTTGNVTFEGSTATASNGSLTIKAGGNISILPLFATYQGQSTEGHWAVNSSSVDVIGSRLSAQDLLSLGASGAINITASDLISTLGGIELLGDQGIHIIDELEQDQIQKVDRKGKTTGQSSEFRTEAVRAILKAGKGVLLNSEFGDVVLKATNITSTEGTKVEAKNGTVHLLMTKELEEFHLQSVSKGTWTIKTNTVDVIHENNIQNAIVGGLQVQAKYGVNVEYTGKEGATLKEQLEEYAKMPEMAWMAKLYNKCWVEKEGDGITAGSISATDPNNFTNCDGPKVNWSQVEEVHEEIRKSKSMLSPAAMAIIAIAVCIAMGPAGANLIGAGGIGGATVTSTTIAGVTSVTTSISLAGAIAQAGMLTLATQAAQSLAAGNDLRETISTFDSDENLRSLAISMATAGAMNYANVGNLKLFDVPTGAEYSFASFGNQAYNAVAGATINSAISVSINGGNSEAYREAFKQNLALHAVNTIGDAMARKIGGLASGQNPQINEAMKYIALAGTGCIIGLASSSASSGSSNSTACYSGAGGSVIGEYVGELYSESKQREQQALIENYLLEKGIANTTDFYNLDPMAYGQLVAQRPKFTHEEIFNMKLIGVDLAKLSAALAAFVAGADVNIAADAGERTSRYSAFYNFDAAMEAVAAIDQFMKLEDVSNMISELKLVLGDESKIDAIIKKYIDSGKFEFLRGLSVPDALDALIKYVKLNGDSLKLVNALKSVLASFPVGRIKLSAAPYRDIAGEESSRLQALLLHAKNNGLYDPRVHIESEKLFRLMESSGFDPNNNEYVATLNALIDLAPVEDRRALKHVIGMAFGVTKFLADTGGDVSSTVGLIVGTPVAATEMVLFFVTKDPDYQNGADKFLNSFAQLKNVLSNFKDIPANVRESYNSEIRKAEAEEQKGNYIEAGKIRSAAGLAVISLVMGVGAILKSVGRASIKNGADADFGDLAEELTYETNASYFSRYLNNITNPEIRETFLTNADSVRMALPEHLRSEGNLALATIDVPGLPRQMKAYSGFNDGEFGFVALPEGEYVLEPLAVNKYHQVDGKGSYLRDVDTEFKILENITQALGDSSVPGRIDLFTELDVCASCGGAITQFRTKYPNIQLNVFTKKQ